MATDGTSSADSENETKKTKKKDLGSKGLGKVVVDTAPPSSGNCPIHTSVYVVMAVLAAMYCAFIIDEDLFNHYSEKFPPVRAVQVLFQSIEKYSPFMEVFETDEEIYAKIKKANEEISKDDPKPKEKKKKKKGGLKVFTKEELAKYDGSDGSPGLYIALLGEVFNVKKGKQYYGPGGGYSFFSGKDAARAYVTGNFEGDGLTDDVEGLKSDDYLGLEEWLSFYNKDYKKVGVLSGRYYTSTGDVTPAWRQLQQWIADAKDDKDRLDVEKQMFPPCNVEWSAEKGTRYWCTTKSGGVTRVWPGVPRQLFYPGREARCACVRNKGAPSTDPGATSDKGDLDNAHVKEYPGCGGDGLDCWIKEKQ